MEKYHKIQSVFKRDPENNYKTFLDEYSKPVFECLANAKWQFTEKVDGRNHRVIWNNGEIEHRGRTNKAHMPDHLLEDMNRLFNVEDFEDTFGDTLVTLYGEAYGAKIQQGEHYIEDHRSFVLFDVFIGGYWLEREDIEGIAHSLGIDVVPVVGEGTLDEAVELVKGGIESQLANTQSEGLILKPKAQLFDRSGNRIITKLKTKDFR